MTTPEELYGLLDKLQAGKVEEFKIMVEGVVDGKFTRLVFEQDTVDKLVYSQRRYIHPDEAEKLLMGKTGKSTNKLCIEVQYDKDLEGVREARRSK